MSELGFKFIMMTLLGTFILGLKFGKAAQAIAPSPYQLIQLENSTYRDWTFEELAQSIGRDSEILDSVKCDGHHEFALTPPFIRTSTSKSSLMIQSRSGPVIYREGVLSPPTSPELQTDGFLEAAVTALSKLEAFPAGRSLLRRLEEARFPITLKLGPNSFNPAEENGKAYHGIYMASAVVVFITLRKPDDVLPFHQIGSGGIVRWDPNLSAQVIEEDGATRVVEPEIALAHELYHALDANRGLLDQRVVQGESLESTSVSEFRAVYFENLIRRQSGRKLRKYYGSQTDGPGLLTAEGQPILIPSPCL